MSKRPIATVKMDLIDQLKMYYEGNDPERKHAITFHLAVKHGIPMNHIRRVDLDNGLLEYYKSN